MERKPIIDDFYSGVKDEADFQLEKWGTEDRFAKSPLDYFWLIGYLAGKAAQSHIAGDVDKARHHTISTAAALYWWHRKLSDGTDEFQPGDGSLRDLDDGR